MSNPIQSATVRTTYSLHTNAGQIVVRDEDGSTLHAEPSALTITAARDSDEIVNAVAHKIPGKIVQIDHDKDTILVTTESTPDGRMPYSLVRYNDGVTIGQGNLTPDQFARYEAMAQMPEGIIRLGALPHDFYDLDADYQDTHKDTTVFFE